MASDLFIQLLEKLFELLKLVKDRQYGQVEQLIEPILLDMQDIHNDYLENLTQAKGYIRAAEIDSAIEFLEIERAEWRPLRTVMQALVGQLALNEDLERYQRLLNVMQNYFNPHSSRPAMFEIVHILSMFRDRPSGQADNYTRQIPDLIQDIDYVSMELEILLGEYLAGIQPGFWTSLVSGAKGAPAHINN